MLRDNFFSPDRPLLALGLIWTILFAHFSPVQSIDQNLVGHNSSRRGVNIALIGWRWDEIGRYLVVVIFFLLGAFAKISYHNTRWLRTQIPESCVLIILGSCVGLILHLADIPGSTYIPQFTPEKFFYFYLPPIILESAYELHDKTFFNNIGTIMLLAVVGTIINIIGIGISIYICSEFGFYLPFRLNLIECFTFSTLISAVDPVAVIAIFQEVNVDKALYFLVFGESLLNDAVVVTMYNTMTTFASASTITMGQLLLACLSFTTVSGGGIIMGLIFGALTSLITKFTYQVRVIEPLIVILCAYLSYFAAELLHFSGIICLTCCGLIQASYTCYNISSKSNITIKYFIKTLSSISEVIIFLFLGMILIRDIHTWNCNFTISVLTFCIIYRFASIYFLTFICNNFSNRLRAITRQEQFIMAYGGLRGAIAFALAIMLHPRDIPSYGVFVTATMATIIFTVFVQGSTTKPIVRLLGLQMTIDTDPKLFGELHRKVIETTMNGIEDVIGQTGARSFIGKSFYHANKSANKLLIRDYTDRWSTVRHTMDKIELSQTKSIFTMVKSIPDKHSASEFGRNFNPFSWKLGSKGQKPKSHKANIVVNSSSVKSDQSNYDSNQSSHNSQQSNYLSPTIPSAVKGRPHSKVKANFLHKSTSSLPYNVNNVKPLETNRTQSKINKMNGFAPSFVGYQSRITYTQPKEYLFDQLQEQSKASYHDAEPDNKSSPTGDPTKPPTRPSTRSVLATKFSSDSRLLDFQQVLHQAIGSEPELNSKRTESKGFDEESKQQSKKPEKK